MAKCNRSKKRPQPRHKKQKKSRHDKRRRLDRRNPKRKKTSTAKVPLAGAMQKAVAVLQAVMDRRIAFRLWRSSSAGCSWPAIDARPARGSSSPECKTIGTGSTIA